MSKIKEYSDWWKKRPLYFRIRDRVWWRLSYLWAFFMGGPCVAERFLLVHCSSGMEKEWQHLMRERAHLVIRLLDEVITAEEENRKFTIEGRLDEIEAIMFRSSNDILEGEVRRAKELAIEVTGLVESLNNK